MNKRHLKTGDPFIDWMFRQFLVVLNSKKVKVIRKKRLVNPDEPDKGAVRGLMDPDVHPSGNWTNILINPAKNTHKSRDEEVETLIHELAHIIMPRSDERSILLMERLLSKRFSTEQINALKSYIPTYEVKRYPQKT